MEGLASRIGFCFCTAAIASRGSRVARSGAILAIDDIANREGLLREGAADAHRVTMFSAVITSAIAGAGSPFRSLPERFLLAWDTFSIARLHPAHRILLFRIA